jgi:hypothetical protein
VAAYGQVVDRYEDDLVPALRELTAQASYNMGVRLGVLDRSNEAVAVYRVVVHRYGDDPIPVVRELVAQAQN